MPDFEWEDPRIAAAELDRLDPDPTGELADWEHDRWENAWEAQR